MAEGQGTPPPTVPTTVTDPDRSRHIVTGNATYNYTSDKGDEIGRRIQEKHGSVIPSTGEPHSAIVTGRSVHPFSENVQTPTAPPMDSPAKNSSITGSITYTPYQDNWETRKAGIAFICVTTGYPNSKDYIENCSAGDRMAECLETKLGYHVVRVGINSNMTSKELADLLASIKESKLPESCRRAIFYFFGHGTASQIKTADGYYERRDIVVRFQSICDPELDVYKIIIFECCRRDKPVTCEPVQESAALQALSIDTCSKAEGTYPIAKNTLVIDATNFNHPAQYVEENGCGLFAGDFTELAPTKNISLHDLLVQIRIRIVKRIKMVNDDTKTKKKIEEQLVDFRDLLMGSIHLLAESQGTARVTATCVTVKPSALTTDIEWQVEGKVPDDLLRFDVEISPVTLHAQVLEVEASGRHATVSGLGSAMEYNASVVAVYNDYTLATSETKVFKTPEIQVANIQSEPSPTLTSFCRDGDTLTAVHTVQLSYESPQKPQLKKDHFKVTATPTTPVPAREGEDTVTEQSKERSVELKLELGIDYTLTVSTHYTDPDGNNGCYFPSKEEPIILTAPTESEVRPKIDTENIVPQQTKAAITYAYPAIIPDVVRVTGITIIEEPCDGENNTSKSSRKPKFVEFKQPCSPSSSSRSPVHQQQHRGKITNLEAEREYSMKLRLHYSTGDYVDSEGFTIDTPPYTGCQKGCCCSIYVSIYTLLLFLLFASLFLCGSYAAYRLDLHRHTQCETHYILTYNSVECGSANALQYHMMTVEGTPKSGDTLLGVMQAWLHKEDELDYYSELHNPVIDGGAVPGRLQVFLNGWQIYTWKGSGIYGYCCITNNGSTEQTAWLYLFTNDSDVVNFVNGLGAKNTIISEPLVIPPGRQECFKQWGTDDPYTVTRNSYHFFGVDVPANASYSSNITVHQVSVNTTNLGTPHYFKFNNGTEFRISKHLFRNENYIVICKAPSDTPLIEGVNQLNVSRSKSEVDNSSLASMVGSQSVHINSCSVPWSWKIIPILILVGGIALFFVILSTYFVACICMWKCHKKRLFLSKDSCKRQPRHGQYDSIQNQD